MLIAVKARVGSKAWGIGSRVWDLGVVEPVFKIASLLNVEYCREFW